MLVVKEHDLDTKAEPEQKEIANTFKIQHEPVGSAQMSPFIMVRTIQTPVKLSQVRLSNSNLCLICQN